jgi:hypothetical protein
MISHPTPFARPRSKMLSSRGNSASDNATITLPQTSNGTPSARQNSSIASFPSRQFFALSDPGL